jgi:hypothetical protein
MRRVLAVVALMAVLGCGGGGENNRAYSLGGKIAGLAGGGLVLATPGQANLQVAAGQTTFTFLAKVPTGTTYDVTVIGQPTGPAQTCQVASGTGVVGTADVSSISVTCVASSDAPTGYFDGPRAVVQLMNAWGGYCSGTAFVGNRSATAPVYVLTAGHCYAITFGDEVFSDVPNTDQITAYFDFFPDAPPGAPFTAGVTAVRYSTMWGHDLTLLELDVDQAFLAARGVALPTLAAAPPAGGDVFTYGYRADEPVMRRTDFTLGPRVWIKESVWNWMSVLRGEGPVTYVRGGSSGSPVFAQDTSEIFGVINTRSEELPAPTCELNYPCEVGSAGVGNVPLRAYFQDATRLKGCFTADGLFDRGLAGCRLPGSTFSLQPVAGQPTQLAVIGNTGGVPAGAYRYRVSPLSTFDPADASGYAAPTTAPSFTFAPTASPFVVTAVSETDFHAEGIDPLVLHAVVFWQ